MDQLRKSEILERFKNWFRESLIKKHRQNTDKLRNLEAFQVNPFLLYYLSNYFKGNSDSISLAKVLLYPRVLGTSINTSFGTQIQHFITDVFHDYASPIQGIDIEFIDQIDGRKKFCQLKSGPNAINKDDVKTISDHFRQIGNVARINKSNIRHGDFVFCLIYGESHEKNAFIVELSKDYDVFIGKEFWYRLTGDESFYSHLIEAAGQVAKDINMKDLLDEVVYDLSKNIELHYSEFSKK